MCRSDVDQLMALTREVCALKLSESQLLANVAAASSLSDSRALRIHHLELETSRLKDSISRSQAPSPMQQYLSSICKEVQDLASASELRAQLVQKDQEVYTLRCALVEVQQECSGLELQYKEVCEKLELQKIGTQAELQKAGHKLAAAEELWKAEAQKQQDAVAQQLMAADSRSRELTATLSHQVCFMC